MKAYIAPRQLRLVGKAYEIRFYLKALLGQSRNPHQPLECALKSGNDRPPANAAKLPWPQPIPTGKTQHPRVIAFPSS